MLSSPTRSRRSPAEYPQTESGNLQYSRFEQKWRSVFFIPSIRQGFIFPSQDVAIQSYRCHQQHLASIHHLQAYAYITHIISSFTLRISLRNALHTSWHCIKLTLPFQDSSQSDKHYRLLDTVQRQSRQRFNPGTHSRQRSSPGT